MLRMIEGSPGIGADLYTALHLLVDAIDPSAPHSADLKAALYGANVALVYCNRLYQTRKDAKQP
jgi:hypothetical protein